jgi:hypothetical protein
MQRKQTKQKTGSTIYGQGRKWTLKTSPKPPSPSLLSFEKLFVAAVNTGRLSWSSSI